MLVESSVTVAASSVELALLATIKTELGITDTSQDAKLTRLLRATATLFQEELGREPWLQTYSDRLAGPGGTRMYLPHWPVKGDVSSVTYGTGSSPTTVDSTTYTVAGRRRNYLRRVSLWALSEPIERTMTDGSEQTDYTVAYEAGWVLPPQITTWSANASVAANAWYAPTDTAGSSNITDPLLIFQADSDGGTTHASTEPTWPTAEEGTVTDNDITWTAYRQRLPHDVEEAAMFQVMSMYEGGGLGGAQGVAEEAVDGARIRYRASAEGALTSVASTILARYR